MLALAASWQPNHAATLADYDRRLNQGGELVLSSYALLEAYAVLTRLPGAVRELPETVRRVLLSLFSTAEVVGAQGDDIWSTLEHAAESGVVGDRVYDAVIAAEAHAAGAQELLTWNVRQMRAVAPPGLKIVSPILAQGDAK